MNFRFLRAPTGNIMMVEKTSVDEILFIGDSPKDRQVAQNLAVHFIGVDSGRGFKIGGSFHYE